MVHPIDQAIRFIRSNLTDCCQDFLLWNETRKVSEGSKLQELLKILEGYRMSKRKALDCASFLVTCEAMRIPGIRSPKEAMRLAAKGV
jgi:hypothetical protein